MAFNSLINCFIIFTLLLSCKSQWTYEALAEYTLKNHGKEKYFICDPNNYIEEEEKEVIYYRLEILQNKMNMSTLFFIVNKISLDGINFGADDKDIDEEEFSIPNKTGENITTNSTKEKEIELDYYFSALKKKLFSNKLFVDRESNYLIGIYSIEDIRANIYVGNDFKDIIKKEEIQELLQFKDYEIEKGKIYYSVDTLFSNILFRHSPSLLDRFNKFLGFAGEIIGLISIFIVMYFYQRNQNQQSVPSQTTNSQKNNKEKIDNKKQDILEKKKEAKEKIE